MTDQTQETKPLREHFSARLLRDDTFQDAVAITKIMEREINRTGTFKEKLSEYSIALARSERFDTMKAEGIIRDLFKERVGVSMNQMREQLVKHEDTYTDADQQRTAKVPDEIKTLMERHPKMTFQRAFSQKASELGVELGVTDRRAQTLIRNEFEQANGGKFYDYGKSLDESIYRPQIDASKKTASVDKRIRAPRRQL